MHERYKGKIFNHLLTLVFSSPEPEAPGELIGWYRPSSVRRQHFQRTSPLKLLDRFQLNFICSFQAKGKEKFIYLVQVTYLDGRHARIW